MTTTEAPRQGDYSLEAHAALKRLGLIVAKAGRRIAAEKKQQAGKEPVRES